VFHQTAGLNCTESAKRVLQLVDGWLWGTLIALYSLYGRVPVPSSQPSYIAYCALGCSYAWVANYAAWILQLVVEGCSSGTLHCSVLVVGSRFMCGASRAACLCMIVSYSLLLCIVLVIECLCNLACGPAG